MNTFSISDLEKAIAYAKKHSAVQVTMEIQELDNRRLLIGIIEPSLGKGATITVYAAESTKLPTITHTETLFT